MIPFKGSSRSHFILRRGGEVAGPRFPRHPARKYAVPVNQRVHQRRSEVGKECREQQKRKNHVRCPQRGVEGCVMRQDRRHFKRPIGHDRIAAADSIPQPTSGKANISAYRTTCDACAAKRCNAGMPWGNSGGVVEQPIHEADRNENKDQDTQRPVNRDQSMIVRKRRDHADADEQHRQDQDRHRPV